MKVAGWRLQQSNMGGRKRPPYLPSMKAGSAMTETWIIPPSLADAWDGTDSSIMGWFEAVSSAEDAAVAAGLPADAARMIGRLPVVDVTLWRHDWRRDHRHPGTMPEATALALALKDLALAGFTAEHLVSLTGLRLADVVHGVCGNPVLEPNTAVVEAYVWATQYPGGVTKADVRRRFGHHVQRLLTDRWPCIVWVDGTIR